MKRIIVLTSLVILVLSVRPVRAQPAFDIKYQPDQGQTRPAQQTPPPVPSAELQTTRQEVNQQQEDEKPTPDQWAQPQTSGDPQVTGWLGSWWRTGFLSGILLLFPWAFVGWQWGKLKFWGFGWPWPWWFWLPLWWFIPWLVVGWFWWLVWWPWWIWVWWIWPWLFWLFWWVILFKEMTIAQWRRRKGSVTTE